MSDFKTTHEKLIQLIAKQMYTYGYTNKKDRYYVSEKIIDVLTSSEIREYSRIYGVKCNTPLELSCGEMYDAIEGVLAILYDVHGLTRLQNLIDNVCEVVDSEEMQLHTRGRKKVNVNE